MKTKIIYISGNELFEMTDIRAAFEEVRATLGLDKDTILFGVPVDMDDALPAESVANDVEQMTECIATVEEIDAPEPQISQPEVAINTDVVATTDDATNNTENDEKIIPILSVLGATAEPDTECEQPITMEEPVTTTDEVCTDDAPENEVAPETVAEETVTPVVDNDIAQIAPEIGDADSVEEISIGDMINDEVPVAETKKTLEELLESMKPLREEATPTTTEDIEETDSADDFVAMDTDDTDATLAQLASEFAENEDKIVASPKPETHGKIGKLKNILPFKKAKRDEGSLMGDLFGWAGIAANDDDFAMPGFFSAAGQKN